MIVLINLLLNLSLEMHDYTIEKHDNVKVNNKTNDTFNEANTRKFLRYSLIHDIVILTLVLMVLSSMYSNTFAS